MYLFPSFGFPLGWHVLHFLLVHHAVSPSLAYVLSCCYWFGWRKSGMLFHILSSPLPFSSFPPPTFVFLIAYNALSDCQWCSLETHSCCPNISISFFIIFSKLYFPRLFCCVCCMCYIHLFLVLFSCGFWVDVWKERWLPVSLALLIWSNCREVTATLSIFKDLQLLHLYFASCF